MVQIHLTLSIDEKERAALETLSKVEGRPIDQLVNDVVKGFLRRQDQEERTLEASTARLREYRIRDPKFHHAISAFVEAESVFADPLEGEALRGEFLDGEFKPAGRVQNRIRDLLGA